ncbi:hypothetical protein KIPB_017237, partial [Kipferlia bialata]|eukprot:g17237.t1
MTEQTWPFV